VLRYRLSASGQCPDCGTVLPGIWGPLRAAPADAVGLVHIRCG
jgi:hypothetical protein